MIEIISKEYLREEDEIKTCLSDIVNNYNRFIKYIKINIITDEELVKINKEFLQKNYLTDIITFNYSEGNEAIEGDVYISRERIVENAKEVGVEWVVELYRIMIHGVLHLCGEDDFTLEERERMTSLENRYLARMVSRET